MQRQGGGGKVGGKGAQGYGTLAEKLVPVEIYSGEARTTNYRTVVDLS